MMRLIAIVLAISGASAFHLPPPSSLPTALPALVPGSTVALVTPMLPTGALDLPAYSSLLEWHMEQGTDGLCVLGTTGEAATMSMEERREVLEVTQELCQGKIPYMVGCGAIDPNVVVEYCEQALSFGADAALIVTPFYLKPTPRGLVAHYSHIASKVPSLPVVLYNVPGRTCCDMTAAAAKQVYDACPPGYIVGMKEATGDVSRVADYRALLPPDFLLWSGDDATGAEFVLKGGDGVISVTSNVAPKLQSEIMKAANAGDADKVKELNKPLVRLHDDIFVQPNPIPAKYALERMGRAKAGIRTPLHPLDEDLRAVVDAALGEAGLI